MGSSDENMPSPPPTNACHTSSSIRGLSLSDYPGYMMRFLSAEEMTPISSPGACSTETSPTIKGSVCHLPISPLSSHIPSNLLYCVFHPCVFPQCTCDLADYPGQSQTAWVNALIGRIFWDFLREKHWADAVSHKIQKKLSKIRVRAYLLEIILKAQNLDGKMIHLCVLFSLQLPYFMNELTLTELDMGCSMPYITSTSRPEVNHRGECGKTQYTNTYITNRD